MQPHDDFRHYLVIGETDTTLTFLVIETGERCTIPARRASYAPAAQAPTAGIVTRISASRAPEGGFNAQVQHVEYADGSRSEYLGTVLPVTVRAHSEVVSQIADDHGLGDFRDRIVLPDGSLAFVGEDHLSGEPRAYRYAVCSDYGENELSRRRADQSCVGMGPGRVPHLFGYDGLVADVRLTYAGTGPSCTGTVRYRVELVRS